MRRNSAFDTMLVSILGYLSLVACTGTTAERPMPKPHTSSPVAEMAQQYALTRVYSDHGTVEDVGVDGFRQVFRFNTRFTRGSALRFEFSEEDELPTVSEFDLRKLEVASAIARLQAMSGVSGLSSRFVPLMLLGQDPCDCLDREPARLLGVDKVRGLDAQVFVVYESEKKRLSFWISFDNKLLRAELLRKDSGDRTILQWEATEFER